MEKEGTEEIWQGNRKIGDRKVGWTPPSKINPGGLGAAAAKRKAEREAKEKEDADKAKKTGKKVTTTWRSRIEEDLA